MFSEKERTIYENNPLAEVICQLRFPEILSISANEPAAFQEIIRNAFPVYARMMEAPAPRITGVPGNMTLQNQNPTPNYQFMSEDKNWRVNLTSKFISLACNRYTCWEEFAAKLDQPLAAFITTYRPAFFERVGLRYVNFFSRQTLHLENTPWSEMFAPCYLGPMAEEDTNCDAFTKCSVDFEMNIRGGCRAKIHAGPGLVKRGNQQDPEVKFVFDQDLYMPGKVPVNLSAGAMETLHSQAYPIFRGAVTELTHRAMQPRE